MAELSNEKDKLTKLAKEIGIYDSFAGAISGASSIQTLNVVKLDIVQASKVALSNFLKKQKTWDKRHPRTEQGKFHKLREEKYPSTQ